MQQPIYSNILCDLFMLNLVCILPIYLYVLIQYNIKLCKSIICNCNFSIFETSQYNDNSINSTYIYLSEAAFVT